MIAIKLDSSAMEALFKDPDAKLELQQAVIAEMCRRMFDKYLPTDVRNIIDAIFKAQRVSLIEVVKQDAAFQRRFNEMFAKEIANIKSTWNGKTVTVLPEMQTKIKQAIETQSQMILHDAKVRGSQLVEQLADEAFQRLRDVTMADVDKLVSRKVRAMLDSDIDKIVEARVEAALKVAKS